jgi:transposase
MPPCKILISEADKNTASYEFANNSSRKIRLRMLCLVLKFYNLDHALIALILACHRNTVGNYLRIYGTSGLTGLKQLNYVSGESDLEDYWLDIDTALTTKPPRTLKEAAFMIFNITGIKRGLSQVATFLKKHEFKSRKTGFIPAKACLEQQATFLAKVIKPLLNKAKKGKCTVLFLDSAHFVMAPFVSNVWSKKRVFIKASPGRYRLNVIGAIDAISRKFIGIYNEDYITATTVVELIEKISVAYQTLPVHIFLDNARYQHCQFVKDAAERLGINLIFLPTYSPNLNLIERLWKFVKAEACATRYFETKEDFKKSILDFLNGLDTKKRKKELKTRLSHNFQLFRHAQNHAA